MLILAINCQSEIFFFDAFSIEARKHQRRLPPISNICGWTICGSRIPSAWLHP